MKLVMSAADFEPLDAYQPSPVEIEVRRRIKVSVGAYAYEVANTPIMSDADWDRLAAQIDRRAGTCHPLLDEFFATQFSPMTAMWIHNHPELEGIKRTFDRYYAALRGHFERR
jgi:hypothetical protein